MKNQQDFLQTIMELKEMAAAQGGQISPGEIRGAFPEMELTEEHLRFISSYLAGYHIEVEEYEAQEENWEPETMEEDPGDSRLADLYLQESLKTAALSPEETEELLARLAEGREEARDRLVEANLPLAAELAAEYRDRGLFYSDLIQESNLGLLLAIDAYRPGMEETFEAYLSRSIRQQIEEALREYNASTRSSVEMAGQINQLNEISAAFAREHGREAKIEELASRMGIPEEEIRILMKASLDAVNLLEH